MNTDIIMSQKPYLIRAMYEWMLDYGYTPRLVICPLVDNVIVPNYLLNQNQITLDISPKAINGLHLGNDTITFEAYFSKAPHDIKLPLNCIGAIIAKEKEVGYVFDIDDFIPPKARNIDTSIANLTESEKHPIEPKKNSPVEKKQAKKTTSKKVKSTKKNKPSKSKFSFGKNNSSVKTLSKAKKKPTNKKKQKKTDLISTIRQKISI